MTEDPTSETHARRQRLVRFARDAEDAIHEHADMQQEVEERTARLREQRLARDAAVPAAKRNTGGKARRTTDSAPEAAPAHRFLTGQRVKIVGHTGNSKSPRGLYKIVSQLPADRNGNCYRVRSETEPHDRVVGEAQLSPVGD